ncbi:hypothetical protein I4U23_010130 [Adineta vaga]|nr:hypothetical protein I4U23_010130 [Adineta vaga]
MSSIRKVIRTIILRSLCITTMDQSTKPKRNRAEKKNKKQQKKESTTEKTQMNDTKNDDSDSVFNEDSQLHQKLPESNISTEILAATTETMSSVPNRPASIASTASNQNTPNQNKKQGKQTKPSSEASSMNDVSEITDRMASTTIQQNPNGPPISIPPKPQLSRAERRAIQEAQRAAKPPKQKPGTPALKPNETPQTSATSKKPTIDHTPTPSISAHMAASHRIQSEISESTMSANSRPVRQMPTSTAPSVMSNQSQQKRLQKKANSERVTLFSHLSIYTRDLSKLPVISDSDLVHPAIVKLGLQYATRQIVGSNLRCVAFLVAIQKMLEDYEGPHGSNNSSILNAGDLSTKLKNNINFLTKCRPNAVTMGTAIRYLKTHIERIPHNITIEKAKELLNDVIQSFLREKIELSGTAIAETYAITKITNGDVILIFG